MHRFGPYKLVRQLAPLGPWQRWIALHEGNDTDHIVYRNPAAANSADRRRLLPLVEKISRPRHAHLLPIEAYSFDDSGSLCLVSPYTGNQEGLVSIGHLLSCRSGRLEVGEVARCVEHLLEAIAEARRCGVWVSQLDPARVLIDRRGSVIYELYGLVNPKIAEHPPGPVADEIRSVAEIAAWLLTGIEPGLATVSVARVAGRTARGWDAWVSTAVDPLGGFDSIEDAYASMPTRLGGSMHPQATTPDRASSPISVMIKRFRRDPAAIDVHRE
ncbi:MAG: hypothetical protein AB8F26_05525 [Phycisphaerales bacterium]